VENLLLDCIMQKVLLNFKIRTKSKNMMKYDYYKNRKVLQEEVDFYEETYM